jgi:hypothetical protein
MTARKLDNLLNRNENAELADLVRRAQKAGALVDRLTQALPAELAGDLVAANVHEDGELVVICRTPARAARVRYESGTLMAVASSAAVPVTRVTVRVSHEM